MLRHFFSVSFPRFQDDVDTVAIRPFLSKAQRITWSQAAEVLTWTSTNEKTVQSLAWYWVPWTSMATPAALLLLLYTTTNRNLLSAACYAVQTSRAQGAGFILYTDRKSQAGGNPSSCGSDQPYCTSSPARTTKLLRHACAAKGGR